MLPVLMLLFAMLLQPICAFYTLAIMNHTAAECARVTLTTSDDAVVRSFALRRLRAVPEASLFHVGGQRDWSIDVRRSDGGRRVSVAIAGHLRPLPLFGVSMRLLGKRDGVGVRMEVEAEERMRPAWLGGSYGDWVSD